MCVFFLVTVSIDNSCWSDHGLIEIWEAHFTKRLLNLYSLNGSAGGVVNDDDRSVSECVFVSENALSLCAYKLLLLFSSNVVVQQLLSIVVSLPVVVVL